MNLITDKWVRVLKIDGSYDLMSLHELFLKSESIATLEYPIYEKAALLSLLACIAQESLGKIKDNSDWEGCKNRIISSACDYLLKNIDCFNLYDDSKPFLQLSIIKDIHKEPFRSPVNEMSLERPFKDRVTFYDHDAHLWKPSDIEIASMLLPYSMFDLGGLFNKTNTWDGGKITASLTSASLSKKMIMIIEGECLLDTVWYHVFPEDRFGKLKKGKPFWSINFKTQKDMEEYALTYYGNMMPISRSILIDEKSRRAFLGETLPCFGGKDMSIWNECRHPMMVESTKFKGKNKTRFQEKTEISPEKEVWRQLGAVMSMNYDPNELSWAFGHARTKGKLFIYLGGLAVDQAEILCPVESVFCFDSNLDKDGWMKNYAELFNKADEICFHLKCAMDDHSEVLKIIKQKRRPISSKAQKIYWSKISNHVNVLFNASDLKSPYAIEYKNKWISTCWKEAFNTYNSMALIYNGQTCEAYGLGVLKLQSKGN